MKSAYFTPLKLISTAQSSDERIDLLAEQLEWLRHDLEEILDNFENRLAELEA